MTHSSSHRQRIILAAAVAGVLVAVGTGAVWQKSGNRAVLPENIPAAAPAVISDLAPADISVFDADAPPARLIIPSLKIDAVIQGVGLTETGEMGVVANPTDVGWYKYGPYPGAPGNSVIGGHLDTARSPVAVFRYLENLKPGDAVMVVDTKGRTMEFVVTGSKLYGYNDKPDEVFGPSAKSRLNLVTCDGTWIRAERSYDQRLVVFTERVR